MMHTWREVGKVALGLATLVREGRLELPWVAPLDPKSSASTSSATLALCQVFSVYGSDGKFTLQTSPLQVKDRDDGEGSMTSTIRMASAFGVREFWNTGVHEIPNSKHQITNKSQIPIPNDRNRF